MRLLLHACCGPCSMYPQEVLQGKDIDYDMLWFNPNIHPAFEFDRRLQNLRLAAEHYSVALHEEGQCMEDYWLSGEYKDRYPSRCLMCYDMRMDMAAKYAAEHGFDSFSTSLLVSPYQQHEKIIEICKEKSGKYGVEFYYYDFREGFRKGQQMARDIGLYRQKFCGCIFSLNESEFKEKILKSMS